jgi:hypothetical protein
MSNPEEVESPRRVDVRRLTACYFSGVSRGCGGFAGEPWRDLSAIAKIGIANLGDVSMISEVARGYQSFDGGVCALSAHR